MTKGAGMSRSMHFIHLTCHVGSLVVRRGDSVRICREDMWRGVDVVMWLQVVIFIFIVQQLSEECALLCLIRLIIMRYLVATKKNICRAVEMCSLSPKLVSSTSNAELRKIKKPLIERKRRERINHCLRELKVLVLEARNKDVGSECCCWNVGDGEDESCYSKMEKADILEMTVAYLKTLQRHRSSEITFPQPNNFIDIYKCSTKNKCKFLNKTNFYTASDSEKNFLTKTNSSTPSENGNVNSENIGLPVDSPHKTNNDTNVSTAATSEMSRWDMGGQSNHRNNFLSEKQADRHNFLTNITNKLSKPTNIILMNLENSTDFKTSSPAGSSTPSNEGNVHFTTTNKLKAIKMKDFSPLVLPSPLSSPVTFSTVISKHIWRPWIHAL
ncbi:hypothetical protein HELRODRAFT_162289 [Helobdella robusta]|uniref:BHLH domain-containing protein n=1 Tax=Helobdella robusta TaxID=6412 RepID=T1ESG6_HELRO|nr:hypothetical protein HELRODRAFT_162289 [Helobdella robusta]ESN98830.1 hypothetical protein HELRODRAFT_162289 [Helobdella robusta]